jgi:hypothetical protein
MDQCLSRLRRHQYDGFGRATSDVGLMILRRGPARPGRTPPHLQERHDEASQRAPTPPIGTVFARKYPVRPWRKVAFHILKQSESTK